ncbi:hypothetical protein ABZT10_33745, partial [Streptomyces sp900116325]
DAEELFSLSHFIGVTRPGHVLTDDGLPEGGVGRDVGVTAHGHDAGVDPFHGEGSGGHRPRRG